MKLFILCAALALPISSFAESCTGTIFIGDLQVTGQCMNSNCQAIWNGFLSTSVNCGTVSASLNGTVGGASIGSCVGGLAHLQIGGASIDLSGRCSDGKMFSGQALMSGSVAQASCQSDGPVHGSVSGGFAQVIGNCN